MGYCYTEIEQNTEFDSKDDDDIENFNKNVKKMSRTLKNIFWTLLGSKMGGPPEPPATARTPRPIFDDKKCSKNVFFNVRGIFFTLLLTCLLKNIDFY